MRDIEMTTHTHRYRVTNKEWDCKDDLKLIKFDDSVKSSALNIVFEWPIYWHNNERNKFKSGRES